MNKRIKRKLATKENKNMMESTLKYLKHLGLTPLMWSILKDILYSKISTPMR